MDIAFGGSAENGIERNETHDRKEGAVQQKTRVANGIGVRE
jgi:hypothetical protein